MLLTPAETLKTSDRNHSRFITANNLDSDIAEYEIWSVVAVTLEKNVAIVVMLAYCVVSRSFSSARKDGRAGPDNELISCM